MDRNTNSGKETYWSAQPFSPIAARVIVLIQKEKCAVDTVCFRKIPVPNLVRYSQSFSSLNFGQSRWPEASASATRAHTNLPSKHWTR